MEIVYKKLSDIKPYENNPRLNDKAVEGVANSIKEFGFKVPIVIDKDNTIVCGHTRYKASKKLKLNEVPCIVADDLTEEQINAYRLADNKVSEASEWDFEVLADELDGILDIDMSQFGFSIEPVKDYTDALNDKNLQERFLCPPMSILDTRKGYWVERKNQWKSLGIKSEIGRKEGLTFGELSKAKNLGSTSVFCPVLCEVAYKWFNVEGGKIFDSFAGGSVRGIVASKLGYEYCGIDLRQEQVDANYENQSEIGTNAVWYCDDSLNADKYIDDNSVDMLFSCPPYADLEVYSDDERDLSNMEYEDFLKAYNEIIRIACRKLKENRFAVWVVGEVRDKKGFYRDFVSDTKKTFIDAGLKLYNDMVLIEPVGTGAIRAGKLFTSSRKVVKTHQNVLVFYKGDTNKIKENFNQDIAIMELEEGNETD